MITAAATCVSSQSVECEDGTICPAGTTCFVLTNGITACGVEAPVCGDGRLDAVNDEACDDGIPGLSGDGCTSLCTVEFAVWRDLVVVPHPPSSTTERAYFAFATDPVTGVMLYGGGAGSGPSIDVPPGFDDTWRWTGVAWSEAEPLLAPKRRNEPAIAYDRGRKRVVMFGGVGANNELLGDTFEWDGYTWHGFGVPGPSPRAGASLACSPGRCVLFGGRGVKDTLLDDAWVWDGTSWTPLVLPNAPSKRSNAVMTYDHNRGRFVLFGGDVGSAGSAESWELDDDDGWLKIPSTPVPWSGKPYPAGAYDEMDKRTIVLIPTPPQQTWAFDGTSWTVANGSGSAVGTANFLALATNLADGRVVAATSFLETPYRFDGANWAPIKPIEPPLLNQPSAAYDLHRARTIVVSQNGMAAVTRTNEWDGRAWQSMQEGIAPSTIVYDSVCRTTVGFGGDAITAWVYDGAMWINTNAAGPSRRSAHAMAYHAGRESVFLVGGNGGSAEPFLDDFWELRGPCGNTNKTWFRDTTSTKFPPRANAAMAYDPRTDQVVLFGGKNNDGILSDTWVWRRNPETGIEDWEQIQAPMAPMEESEDAPPKPPPPSPPARILHSMAYSPRLGRIVMAGGENSGGVLADTWEWDGTWWREIKTATSPSRLSRFALAPDITGHLFGFAPTPTPTIRLSFENPTEPTEQCIGDFDQDGDGLVGCDDPDCRTKCAPECPVEIPFPECGGPRCGDGEVQGIETYLLCPADVAPP